MKLNKEDIENIENKYRRGLILENLKTKYPEGVDFEVLRKALELQGHTLLKKELVELVEYLHEGGYIKLTYFKTYILVIVLTKKGIDLIDGLIADVGVTF